MSEVVKRKLVLALRQGQLEAFARRMWVCWGITHRGGFTLLPDNMIPGYQRPPGVSPFPSATLESADMSVRLRDLDISRKALLKDGLLDWNDIETCREMTREWRKLCYILLKRHHWSSSTGKYYNYVYGCVPPGVESEHSPFECHRRICPFCHARRVTYQCAKLLKLVAPYAATHEMVVVRYTADTVPSNYMLSKVSTGGLLWYYPVPAKGKEIKDHVAGVLLVPNGIKAVTGAVAHFGAAMPIDVYGAVDLAFAYPRSWRAASNARLVLLERGRKVQARNFRGMGCFHGQDLQESEMTDDAGTIS